MLRYASWILFDFRFFCHSAKVLFSISAYWLKKPVAFSFAFLKASMLNGFAFWNWLKKLFMLFIELPAFMMLLIQLFHCAKPLLKWLVMLSWALLPFVLAFFTQLVFISQTCFAVFI